MPEPRDTLLQLARDFPVALDFVRAAPFGLVAEPITGGDVSVQGYGTFCYVGVGSDLPPLTIVPGLVRLSELVLHGYGIEAGEGSTTYHEELLWFYCYARAAQMTGAPSADLLAPAIGERWTAIAGRLATSHRHDEFDLLRLSLIRGLRATGAVFLRGLEHPVYRDAWEIAGGCESFPEFYERYLALGGPRCTTSLPGAFLALSEPKTRHVIHQVFGRRSGILATTNAPWVGGADGIRTLVETSRSRPLLYDNHDMDRPVALTFNHHLHEALGGHTELHVECFVFDEDHWSRRDQYRGFSLGIQHE